MRICLLEGDMSRSGGTERMTAWLANQLCREHSVFILSLRMEKSDVFFPLDDTVIHEVLPPFPGKLGIANQIRWLHTYIKTHSIDWVINVDMGMGFYGILAAKGTHAKTVTWEHGNYFTNCGSGLFPDLLRYAARHSDAVVVLTQRDRENYVQNISRCVPLYVIPNPAAQRQYNYDLNRRTILSVGHLLPNKGYHRVVEMASHLLPAHPDWKWVICGEGPERANLETAIAEAGLQEQVLLPGLQQDMDSMYRSAAMLVLTSDMEGLPMVLLEGKSYSLPLVAFDIMTGPSDIIDHTVNGYLVEPFNLSIMESHIRELIETAHLRRRMSLDAAVGLEKFTEETILNAWTRLLKEN